VKQGLEGGGGELEDGGVHHGTAGHGLVRLGLALTYSLQITVVCNIM